MNYQYSVPQQNYMQMAQGNQQYYQPPPMSAPMINPQMYPQQTQLEPSYQIPINQYGQNQYPNMNMMQQQGMPQLQGMTQQGMPQQQGMPPQVIPPQQQGMPQQVIPQQQGIPQQGIPQPEMMVQQGIPQQQGMPQQGIPQQGMPPQGIPQQIMPQQVMPQGQQNQQPPINQYNPMNQQYLQMQQDQIAYQIPNQYPTATGGVANNFTPQPVPVDYNYQNPTQNNDQLTYATQEQIQQVQQLTNKDNNKDQQQTSNKEEEKKPIEQEPPKPTYILGKYKCSDFPTLYTGGSRYATPPIQRKPFTMKGETIKPQTHPSDKKTTMDLGKCGKRWELRGGKFYGCFTSRTNGLQDNCPKAKCKLCPHDEKKK